jgi:triacylglycerol lipase
MWDKPLLGAQLSAIAYKNEAPAITAAKKLGFRTVKLVSIDGAEMLVAKSTKELWIAFRGTEPSQLNDVLADLKVIKNTAMAGGKVHGGFQQEVNDLWMEVIKELDANDQLKNPRELYFTGHSLGAAMATIAATRKSPQALYTFGSPRVGGPKFIKNVKCPHMRFMNNNDIVCRIPPAWLGFRHHGKMIYFDRFGKPQDKPTWTDMLYGIWNSWKRWKFFDGITDHGMPNYVKAIKTQQKLELKASK